MGVAEPVPVAVEVARVGSDSEERAALLRRVPLEGPVFDGRVGSGGRGVGIVRGLRDVVDLIVVG